MDHNATLLEPPVLEAMPATMLETGTPQAVALRKEHVIESELKSIELNYRGLKIAGPDDTAGMKIVADARKYCKRLRTTAERICKAGREDAVAEQKRWLQVEKYVVDRIKPIEAELVAEELRIDKLREAIKLEAERQKKAEEDRLQGICNEFAKAGKLMAKDEIRNMETAAVQMLLEGARQAKAKQEADAKKLAEEKRAADAENEALRTQIAELQAQLQAKLNPPPPAAATPATAPAAPEKQPEPPATVPETRKAAPAAAAMPALPLPPAKPAKQAPTQPVFTSIGTLQQQLAGQKCEAELIADDRLALMTFARQVDTLQKYAPDLQSARAAGLTELFKDQVEKFVMFITKKREEL